jgi:diguanylate cyclase (GGDEF)-like protein
MQVAERIRQTLRTLAVKLPDGQQVPTPTVSQGIAMFCEAPEAEKLIDLADHRLYVAKARGRDQVEPGEAHWDLFKAQEAA